MSVPGCVSRRSERATALHCCEASASESGPSHTHLRSPALQTRPGHSFRAISAPYTFFLLKNAFIPMYKRKLTFIDFFKNSSYTAYEQREFLGDFSLAGIMVTPHRPVVLCICPPGSSLSSRVGCSL